MQESHPLDQSLARGENESSYNIVEEMTTLLGPESDEEENWGGSKRVVKDRTVRAGYPELRNEKAHHRMIVALAAQGNTVKQIASILELNPHTVRTTINQPWARRRIRELIDEAAGDNLSTMFGLYAPEAADVLYEIAVSPKASAASRVSAAKELLDRHLGRSKQVIENTGRSASEEGAHLDSELERLRKELTDLQGPTDEGHS